MTPGGLICTNKALFFYSTLLDFRSRRILDGFIYALNCSPCFLAEKRCLLQYFYAARKMLSTLTFWRGMCSLPFPIFNFGVHFINTKYFWYFMYVYTKQIWIVLFLQQYGFVACFILFNKQFNRKNKKATNYLSMKLFYEKSILF